MAEQKMTLNGLQEYVFMEVEVSGFRNQSCRVASDSGSSHAENPIAVCRSHAVWQTMRDNIRLQHERLSWAGL